MLIAQSFGARMKNMPHLSRLLDPPGTKGGPQAHFRRGPPKQAFGPGSWLHPGPKGGGITRDQRPLVPGGGWNRVQSPPLWSWVKLRPGTKGGFWRAAAKMRLRPTFSPGWIYHPEQMGARGAKTFEFLNYFFFFRFYFYLPF